MCMLHKTSCLNLIARAAEALLPVKCKCYSSLRDVVPRKPMSASKHVESLIFYVKVSAKLKVDTISVNLTDCWRGVVIKSGHLMADSLDQLLGCSSKS
jgi:hypothetical protein